MTLVSTGIAMAGVEGISACGAIATRWVRLGTNLSVFCYVFGISGLALAAHTTGSLMVSGYWAFLWLSTVAKILAETLLITRISPHLTATALSVFSLLLAALSGGVHLLMAAVAPFVSNAQGTWLIALLASGALAYAHVCARRMRLDDLTISHSSPAHVAG